MQRTLSLKNFHYREILGIGNRNLKLLKENIRGEIVIRGESLIFKGRKKNFENLKRTFEFLEGKVREGIELEEGDILFAIQEITKNRIGSFSLREEKSEALLADREMPEIEPRESVYIITPKKIIYPRSYNQSQYIKSLREKDITFAIGPAGTGKTFLAVACAVEFLKNRKVERIVLTRPAVEAGESLGYLPGDYKEKVAPYLTPLYDALFAMMPFDRIKKLIDEGVIEIAPLAYMRGRTLSSAYIILDEAQNTTSLQMKMFLTRLGLSSKVAVTGDITQIDLPRGISSGMKVAIEILSKISGVSLCEFEKEDVVRHPVVKEIISAYEKYEESFKDEERGFNKKGN